MKFKSDDVEGRSRAYNAIVNGKDTPKPGIPESFKVLIKEFQSLALDVSVLDEEGNEIDLRRKYKSKYAQNVDEIETIENNETEKEVVDQDSEEELVYEDDFEQEDFDQEEDDELSDDM